MSNTALSYPVPDDVLLSWEFSNPQLSAQVTALLVTILAYQVYALIYDLVFGFKKRMTASSGDLHMALLARGISPLAIATNLFRRDWLTRLYYGRDRIPKDVEIARDPQKIKLRMVARLVILLSVAPICNIIAVVLSLRTEKTLSFTDVAAEGITLTTVEDPGSVIIPQTNIKCTRIPVNIGPGDSSLVDFNLCTSWKNRAVTVNANSSAEIRVVTIGNQMLQIIVRVEGKEAALWKSLNMHSKGKLYAVKLNLPPGALEAFSDSRMATLSRECGASNQENQVATSVVKTEEFVIITKSTSCLQTNNPEKKLLEILLDAERHLAVRKEKQMRIVELDNEFLLNVGEFFSVHNVEFIRRVRKRVGLMYVVGACAITIVLRFCTFIFLNSDTDIGLELSIKSGLGVKCCASLLERKQEVLRYDCVSQNGKCWKYGLLRNGMDEVETIKNGTAGEGCESLAAGTLD